MARIALVLGAGGTVGHAFHAGVLAALVEERGWDARRADVVVGTSAGSIVAAMVRAGMPPADLMARGSGRPLSADGLAVARRAGLGAARPGPERRRSSGPMASPARLARAVRAPWAVTVGSLAAAVMPAGTVSTEDIAVPFDNLYGDAWPDRPTWIVAVQLDTGRRIAFGRPGAPSARMSEAVRASCAIPAFFEPIEIDGRRYVDGGVHSTTNADLVATPADGGPPDLVVVERADVGRPRCGADRPGQRDPPGRPALAGTRGRRPAHQGHPGRRVPADGHRPRGDGRRLARRVEVRARRGTGPSSRRPGDWRAAT